MKRILIIVTAFSLIAFLISLLVFFVDTVELGWAIATGALGAFCIGLAFNSFLLSSRADTAMNEIRISLSQMKELLQGIQKEHKEEGEQKSSGSQILPTLEVFSKFYMDYLNKQKGETD